MYSGLYPAAGARKGKYRDSRNCLSGCLTVRVDYVEASLASYIPQRAVQAFRDRSARTGHRRSVLGHKVNVIHGGGVVRSAQSAIARHALLDEEGIECDDR